MFSFRGIKAGDKVRFHFTGGPANMPEPWVVVKVDYKFSTVNYAHNPSITIKSANDIIETYDMAQIYSPIKVK